MADVSQLVLIKESMPSRYSWMGRRGLFWRWARALQSRCEHMLTFFFALPYISYVFKYYTIDHVIIVIYRALSHVTMWSETNSCTVWYSNFKTILTVLLFYQPKKLWRCFCRERPSACTFLYCNKVPHKWIHHTRIVSFVKFLSFSSCMLNRVAK